MTDRMNCMNAADAVRRFLVLGDAYHQYPLVNRTEVPLVALELRTAEAGLRAVEYLSHASTAPQREWVLSTTGQVVTVEDFDETVPTWNGCSIAPGYAAHLMPRLGEAVVGALAPIVMLRCHDHGDEQMVEVMLATRLRAIGALFTRVARFTAAADTELPALVLRAIEQSTAYHAEVSIEWQEFTMFDRGIEIESKVDVFGQVSIWALASHLSTLVGSDVLPGFVPDVGNEVQRWEMHQQTCEVLSPPEQVGYIAFSEQPTGAYLKYKRFAKDGLRREENIRKLDASPQVPLEQFLATEHPELRVRSLAPFSRTRFDVNVESAETGHFYGIEIDEVIEHGNGHVLRQVEVEYQKSRVHDGLEQSTIVPELDRLTGLIQSYLGGRGVAHTRSYYSKLSFLRDCAAGSYSRVATGAET